MQNFKLSLSRCCQERWSWMRPRLQFVHAIRTNHTKCFNVVAASLNIDTTTTTLQELMLSLQETWEGNDLQRKNIYWTIPCSPRAEQLVTDLSICKLVSAVLCPKTVHTYVLAVFICADAQSCVQMKDTLASGSGIRKHSLDATLPGSDCMR